MRSFLSLWIAIFLLTLSPAGSEEVPELITDRPDQTESSVTVPAGTYQLELGWTMIHDDDGTGRVESREHPGTLLRIGLSERVELRLGWAGQIDEDVKLGDRVFEADGAGDGELGAKFYLQPAAGSAPEIALLVSIAVPIGDPAFTSDRYDPSFRLLFSHSLTDRLDLGYNFGMELGTEMGDDSQSHTLSSYVYTAALGMGLTERWGAFVELYGEVPASAEGGPAHSFDGGLTYLVRDHLQIDLAAGVGLSDEAADWFVGLGLSVRWPR